MTFNLKISEVKAALLICSKDETRYVLCGIHVELKPDQQPLIVATDGRRLIAIHSEAPQESVFEKSSVTISANALADALRLCGRLDECLRFDCQGLTLLVNVIGAEKSVRFGKDGIIEGLYPKWRQTIPKKASAGLDEIAFNAIWAADFSKAVNILGGDGTAISIRLTSQTGAFLVRAEKTHNFLGVLMPCRVSIAEWSPLWIGADEETKPKEQELAAA